MPLYQVKNGWMGNGEVAILVEAADKQAAADAADVEFIAADGRYAEHAAYVVTEIKLPHLYEDG